MLTVKTRIYSSVLLTLAIIAVEGWIGLAGLETIQGRVVRFSEQLVPLTRTISRLETLQAQQNNQFEKAPPAEGTPDRVVINSRIVHDQMARIGEEIERGATQARHSALSAEEPAERRNLERIGEQLAALRQRQAHLDGYLDQFLLVGQEGNAALLPLSANHTLIEESESLEVEVGTLLEAVEESLAASLSGALRLGDHAVFILAGAWLLSLAVGVGLAIPVVRSILEPLYIARGVARSIAGGNLDVRIPAVPHDEFGQLLNAMRGMVAALREQRRMEALLRQSEKMSSLGRLAMGLAHEINNPLANATLHLEMLRRSADVQPADLWERLDGIARNIDKSVKIAQDLLNFSRPRPPAFGWVGIHDTLDCVLSLMQHRLKRVALSRRYDPNLPDVYGIAGKLEQLFMNLIQNAVDAMPQGGRLVVATRQEPDLVVIEIRDSGPGIPPGLRSQVMEAFFTTRHDQGGVGLGLAICQGIVEQHLGSLTVEEAREGGAAMVVRLPRWAVEPIDAGQPTPEEGGQP